MKETISLPATVREDMRKGHAGPQKDGRNNMDYRKLFDMSGKICVVVGGAGYLGSGNAKALQDFGGTVLVTGSPRAQARWEAAEPRIGKEFYLADSDDDKSVRDCLSKIGAAYGRVDVLVICTNASRSFSCEESAYLETMASEEFEGWLGITCGAAFRWIREAVPYMKEHGGSIITYCSMYGVVSPDLRVYVNGVHRQNPGYGAGKAAELQLTRYAVGDLAHYGIRVNCVTPGPFPAPWGDQPDLPFCQRLADHTMLGRYGQPHEMAGAVLLLASDAGSFMTGTNVTVDGGWTAW